MIKTVSHSLWFPVNQRTSRKGQGQGRDSRPGPPLSWQSSFCRSRGAGGRPQLLKAASVAEPGRHAAKHEAGPAATPSQAGPCITTTRVVIWERKVSVLSVLDTALPSCWVPAQLGALSTFLCQPEQWAFGATLTESWRRLLSIWSLQIHGPRFLSPWSQGRCKQAPGKEPRSPSQPPVP